MSDAERYPTLTEHGRRMLDYMREHEAAPIFRNQSGNKLTVEDLADVAAFEAELAGKRFAWTPGKPPPWLSGLVERTVRDVPFFRSRGIGDFTEMPTTSRADLAADIARFVPDHVEPARLINYRTTGTTGHPLLIASHPRVAARYLPFLKRAMRRFGVEPRHGRDQVGVILLGHQQRCFTYVSVTPQMDESGLAKINLHPDDWRDLDDRARYLDAMAPEIIAGDPLSFAELLELPVTHAPRALLSVSMPLTPALRTRLERKFGCPVLDIYSMNEVGPIAVFDVGEGGHILLQPELYVEIVDDSGRAVPSGERGEVTVTGGFNFCLPLLRYRTGDHASLRSGSDAPVLVDLHGRRPIRFRTPSGNWINNIDVSHALGRLPVAQFGLHQASSGALTLRLGQSAMAHAQAGRLALAPLFGNAPIAVEMICLPDKFLQYTSDLDADA